ncbi:MAG: CHASE2 domain-containing protein [Verrucomicrobia bacterium]|nr:CHASE2 domain-containing protein [Verrucomicrobiota bacterium]
MASTKKGTASIYLRWLLLVPIPIIWCLLGHYRQLTFFENKFLDWRMQYRGEIEAPVNLRYVDIDTRAVEAMGERPWSRDLYSSVAEALIVVGGAKAVGFDIVLSRISRSAMVDQKKVLEGNRQLRRVIQENPKRVVLAAQYTLGSAVTQEEGTIRRVPLLRKGMVDPKKNDVPEMPENGFLLSPQGPIARVGLIDADEEYGSDTVPRWAPMFVHTVSDTLYHMSLQLVLQHFGLEEKAVRISPDRVDLIQSDGSTLLTLPLKEGQLLEANWFSKWNDPKLNPRCSVADVFIAIDELNSSDAAKNRSAESFFKPFKDAIVLIGPTDLLLGDRSPTPFDSKPVPRVGLHGNLVKTILSERFVVRLPEWTMWVSAVALTLIVTALSVAGGARGVLAKLVALLAIGGYTLVCFYLFERSNYVLPMAAPLGAAFSTSFAAILWQLIDEERAKGRIKGMFGTYISPQLVEQMVESGEDPKLGGDVQPITAYFSDIQSFSSFSELLTPPQLVELMNEYLTACTDIVQAQGGTLDKYIGDAVVAMFGAPIPLPDHAYRACVATQLVHLRLGELRAKWTADGGKWPEIVQKMQSRIGVNSGPATIGNMGSRTRFNYTMMGDNVNLAARMESGAKSWGSYTMCTEATRAACVEHGGDRVVFRPLGRIVVKGRSQPVPVYEIVGLKESVTPQARECVGVFERALARYYAKDWDGALKLFAQSRELEWNVPGKTPGVVSNPSIVYLDRVVPEAIAEPPPGDWDGRYIMHEK